MRLLVIGNAALDRFYRVARLPAEGESVLMVPGPCEPGGKGLNQAVSAIRAGAEVAFVTMLGRDAAGQVLRQHLAAEGLAGPGLVDAVDRSDESLVLVAPGGRNVVVTSTAAAEALPRAAALDALGRLTPGDLLLMQGNLDPALTVTILARAKASGVRTLFNPSPARQELARALAHVEILIVNEQEGMVFAGAEVPAVVTTLGPRGARLACSGQIRTVPAPAVRAVDTTGAGDVLAGVLAARLALGDELLAALERAVKAASLKVARAGTGSALPSAEELRALVP